MSYFKPQHLPSIDPISRAINSLGRSVADKLNDLEERVATLEDRQTPYFTYNIDAYSTAQTLVMSGWTTAQTLNVEWSKGHGDSFFLAGIFCLHTLTGTFELRIIRGTTVINEDVHIENDGPMYIFGVDKPTYGIDLKYELQVMQHTGPADPTYHQVGLVAMRGNS